MTKRQKKFRLDEQDIDVLEELHKELFNYGLNVNESDIVAMGLRQLKKQGGVVETINRERKEDEAPDSEGTLEKDRD